MNENVETLVRRMWDTRPVRLPRNQSPRTWFFGVCEGISVRYQVSPVLVRLVVGLSVALGGLGLWFYLTALLVLPRYGVPLAPIQVLVKNDRDPRYDTDRAIGVRTLIVIVVLLLLGGVGSGGITVGGVLGGALATGVVWWLLHQRLEVPPAGLQIPSGDAVSTPAPTAAYTGADLGSLTPVADFTPSQTAPPSWDPLGAAPFAWDLPEPSEAPQDSDNHQTPVHLTSPEDPADSASSVGPEAPTSSANPADMVGSADMRTGNFGSSTAQAGVEFLGGPATANGPSSTSRPRKSAWRRLGGVLLGVFLALVLAVVAAVSLLVGGVLHGQEEDTDTTSIRTFTGTAVAVSSVESDRTVEALFSDIDIDLTEPSFPVGRKSTTITVDSRFSSVDVFLPMKTTGPSYRITVDCAQITASDVDCAALDGVVVPSTSATGGSEPKHTLKLVFESSMSVVRTLQRPAP